MKNKQDSEATRFLQSRFGGSTPREAMRRAVNKLATKFSFDALPVKPSRYAKWCRTEPVPTFASMPYDGALKLEENRFKILIRDATSNLELSFRDEIEAARRAKQCVSQLTFDFDCHQDEVTGSNQLIRPDNLSKFEVLKFASVECQDYANLPKSILRRQRFTYAHELCHTFFFDLKAEVPHRPYVYNRRIADPAEESLCHMGASLLLMPTSKLQNYVSKDDDFGFGLIASICNDFDVSLVAAAVRLNYSDLVLPNNVIIVILQYSVNRFTLKDKKYRIRASFVPLALRSDLFIPENAGAEHINLPSLSEFIQNRFQQTVQLHSGSVENFACGNFKCNVRCFHERGEETNSYVISYLRIVD